MHGTEAAIASWGSGGYRSDIMKRAGVVLILLFAFAGLADSVYLLQHETTGTPLICSIQNLTGCNIVAQSPYSNLFGVPLAEYGVLFYIIVFATAALELVLFDRLLRRVLQVLASVGVLASLYFVLIQVFVINALCIYCLGSALLALFICITASLLEPLKRSPPLPPFSRPPAPPFSMPPAA